MNNVLFPKSMHILIVLAFLHTGVFLNAQNQTVQARTISGNVTYLGEPVQNVNITIEGSSRGTTTDRRGNYNIRARIGETINYSHVSYKSISVIVEDITKELFIEMVEKSNELDEIVVIVKTVDGQILTRTKKAERIFKTSRGNFDPRTSGNSIGYVDGNEITAIYSNIKDALIGKISGYEVINNKAYIRGKSTSINQDYPVAWEVDGVFTTDEPIQLDLSQIKDVYALKSAAATNKYGTLGAGGVIIIQTKYGQLDTQFDTYKKRTELYTNKNFYNNNAVTLNIKSLDTSEYVSKIQSFINRDEAYNYYNEKLKPANLNYSDQISISSIFTTQFNDRHTTINILNELRSKYDQNPEILKAIAYEFHHLGFKNELIEVYKQIAKLRPKYAQSYRDLANAYINNNQYKQAWRIYMYYLTSGTDINDSNIDQIIYNEMEYLYFTKADQSKIRTKFIPKNETIDGFINDVRILFEWNTSEAEFNIEFVNPKQQSYLFEHSLAINPDLITDEKRKGYSSKEFLIDIIGTGEWLINLRYFGNKKTDPTFFKVTEYYNWGRSNQYQKTSTFSLKNDHGKIQLIKIDNTLLNAN